MTCEKCWCDAYRRSYGTSQLRFDAYLELLVERKDSPCSPEEQAGQFWDKEKQIDTRVKSLTEVSGVHLMTEVNMAYDSLESQELSEQFTDFIDSQEPMAAYRFLVKVMNMNDLVVLIAEHVEDNHDLLEKACKMIERDKEHESK